MTKKLNALHVVKNAPQSIFRLPGDGRKAKRVCDQRQKFLGWLAFYCDPDGSNIFVKYETLMEKLQLTRDTVWHRFKELEELGFLKTDTHHKYESGPAVRRLLLDAIYARTQESTVRNTNQSPKLDGHQESEIEASEVRNSGIKSPKSTDQDSEIHARLYLPSDLPSKPPQQLPPGSRGSGEEKKLAAMGQESIADVESTITALVTMLVKKDLPANKSKTEQAELSDLIRKHGAEVVTKAFRCYVSNDERLDNSTRVPFGNFLNNVERWLLEAKKTDYQESQRLTPEAIDRATKAAVVANLLERLRNEFIQTLSDEDRDIVNKAKALDYWQRFEFEDLLHELFVRQEAWNKQQKEQEQKAFEDGSW